MDRIILQNDDLCSQCKRELPKGSRCWNGDLLYCDDCADDVREEMFGDEFGGV